MSQRTSSNAKAGAHASNWRLAGEYSGSIGHGRGAVARAAARAVASILNRVPISELPWLDEQLAMRSSVGLDKLLPTTSPSGSSIHAKSVGR